MGVLFAAVVNAEQVFAVERSGSAVVAARGLLRNRVCVTIMHAGAVVAAVIAWPSSVMAQGTTTTTRPAGTDFSVTTGIGSSTSATTHQVEPSLPREGSPIYGLFQSLPDEGEGGPDRGRIDQGKPAEWGAPPSPSIPEGPNAIARDRIESPQLK
jgi:hypothetical protein